MKIRLLPFFIFILCLCNNWSNAQVNVLTQHNNLQRTGWNSREAILNQANVSGGNFGLVFKRTVDDQIYAQPLVVSNINIGGKNRNVVFTATVNNSVYAFDADDTSAAAETPLWHVNLTYKNYRPIANTDMTGACGGNYHDFSNKMGIVCTPVINLATNTIYLVVRSVSTNGQTFVQYLHALDIITGAEKTGSPVYITATVPGNGDANGTGLIVFDQQRQSPRPGLLLHDGTVYICWASHCDWTPYHGWVMGYDAKTLKQKYVYNDSPEGGQAGIWMSGQAPAVDDSGYIYISTGNGSIGYKGDIHDVTNRAESLVKLKPSGNTLKVVDYFTPDNTPYLEQFDLDYGVDGVLLIPNTTLSLSGSKESFLYLINNNKMGGITTDNSNVIQMLDVNAGGDFFANHLHGSPVYFKAGNGQEYVYAWAEGGLLKQFPFDRAAGKFDTLNKKMGVTSLPYGMPGAMLAVSSNGGQNGTGILWASHPLQGNANEGNVPGILQAFAADDVTHELWNSNWNGKRDKVGTFGKFVCPTIANGKVYLATFSNYLAVYGLNPVKTETCGLPANWQTADIGYMLYPGNTCYNNGKFTIQSSGNDIWDQQDAFHYTYQPFNPASGDITARIKSIDATDDWAKCGIMFRKNLDPGSPNVFMAITSANGQAFQNRLLQSDASYSANANAVMAPYWVRLAKRGDKYIGYTSQDGLIWTAVDSVNISLGDYAYAGIAYTTHNNNVQGIAVADHVSFIENKLRVIELGPLKGSNINNDHAYLKWSSSNELSSDKFDIERSDDNVHFSVIGNADAISPLAATNNYTFNDYHPLPGINYYRVKQSVEDGGIKYSNVLPLTFKTYIFNIYPNPAQGQLFIRYGDDLGIGNKVTIQLIDAAGRTIYQQEIMPQGTANTLVLNLPPSIASGLYIVQAINVKGEKRTQKLFVDR